jgi:hypothetical protein
MQLEWQPIQIGRHPILIVVAPHANWTTTGANQRAPCANWRATNTNWRAPHTNPTTLHINRRAPIQTQHNLRDTLAY